MKAHTPTSKGAANVFDEDLDSGTHYFQSSFSNSFTDLRIVEQPYRLSGIPDVTLTTPNENEDYILQVSYKLQLINPE